jgi:hypothetical protein
VTPLPSGCEIVSHPDGDDWLMRPVVEGMCKMESLYSTELDLGDFIRMNDALDLKSENQRRVREAMVKQK